MYVSGLDAAFDALFDNDVTGPLLHVLHGFKVSKCFNNERFSEKDTLDRVKQYSKEQILSILQKFACDTHVDRNGNIMEARTELVGYSQESYLPPEDDMEDECLFPNVTIDLASKEESMHQQPIRSRITPLVKEFLTVYESLPPCEVPNHHDTVDQLEAYLKEAILKMRLACNKRQKVDENLEWISSTTEHETL